MAKGDQKVYMPLMIGDWVKGTRGMRAEVKGVYIDLLLYQWDNGFIPSDMDELTLINPEVVKVWDKLKSKFVDDGAGRLRNIKNDEVKAFWSKQAKNGSKGGRPKNINPDNNPNQNPNDNPNTNHHIDIDLDNDTCIDNSLGKSENPLPDVLSDESLAFIFDQQTMEAYRFAFRNIDIDAELKSFIVKIRGAPEDYEHRKTSGIRNAFHFQLRTAKPATNGSTTNKQQNAGVKNPTATSFGTL
jgi:uncharacterized protein YdaU (DUF1376 family)